MHNLVPQFILGQLAQAKYSGRFTAVALFIDISGFSRVMETLMQHGQHGAEVMASVMLGIFEPLVQFVFEQEGFISNFAGDAFTAFFPIESPENLPTRAAQAVTAAWQAQDYLRTHLYSHTPYGKFKMTAKIGLGLGDATWFILLDEAEQKAAYYFRGTAIDNCILAESLAQPGEIVLEKAIADAVGDGVKFAERNHHFILLGRPGRLLPATPVERPQASLELQRLFFPQRLITQVQPGEFRQTVNVFISLPEVAAEANLQPFIQTVFALQARFGGVISRLDFGDKGCSLLLFWGAPIAHEKDVARALRFLLALRQESPITFRAGVTYRVAHAGFIGSTLHKEFTCYGSGVNLAARFMTKAPNREIWLDQAVFTRANRQFDIALVGNQNFKGFAKKQAVYRLISQEETAAPIFSGQMLGRSAELDLLNKFHLPLVNGRFAGALRIEGEAGIGKSRLLHSFIESLPSLATPPQVFLCQTDQILRHSFNPLRYWLHPHFNQSDLNTEAENKENFWQRLGEIIATCRHKKLAQELERTRSFLGALLDLHWPDSLHAQLDPRQRFENTLLALSALLQVESLRQPALLIIEDVHWLDDDSRVFLRHFWQVLTATPGTEYPLGIIVTGRSKPFAEDELTTIDWQLLNLSPLPTDQLDNLAAELLGGPIGPSLQGLLKKRGEGNPLFTEQIVRYLQDQGHLTQTDAGWETTENVPLVLPQDLHALLVARLDRLTAQVKNGVQHAAVLGREFDVRQLGLMLKSETELEQILSEAENAGIWGHLSRQRYLFRHALLRDAAYKMQLRSRRQALHRLAVSALETHYASDPSPHFGELAYHAEQGNLDEKARSYLHQAGNIAREAYLNNEALDYFGRALALTPADDDSARYALLLAQEKIYHWQGKRNEQQALLDELGNLATQSKEKQVEILLQRARFAEELGDFSTVTAVAQKSLKLARSIQHQKFIADSLFRSGTAQRWLGHTTQAESQIKKALKIYRQLNDKGMEANALFELGEIALEQGNYRGSRQFKLQVMKIAQELNDRHREAFTLNSLGLLAGHEYKYGLAQEHLNQALVMNEEMGNRRGIGVVLNNLGAIAHMLGDYDQAEQYYQRSLTLRRETGERQGQVINLNNLGEVFAKQQRYSDARLYYEQCLQLERELGLRFAEAITLHVYAETLMALRELPLAEQTMQAALTLRRELNQELHHLLPPQLGLAHVAHLQGRHSEARDRLEQVLAGLSSQTLDGLGDPFGFYWLCYTLLNFYEDPRAPILLQEAYRQLQKRAKNIPDAQSRESFLQNVPENRFICDTCQQTGMVS